MDYKELEKMSWNTEDLLEQLLAKTISKVAHNNISKILSMKVLTVDQYKKVLSKIVESLQEIHQKMSQELSIYVRFKFHFDLTFILNIKYLFQHLEQMICNLLGVLKNIRQINYNSKFRDEAAGLMIDLMENKKRLSDGVYIQIMDVAMVILTKSPY